MARKHVAHSVQMNHARRDFYNDLLDPIIDELAFLFYVADEIDEPAYDALQREYDRIDFILSGIPA